MSTLRPVIRPVEPKIVKVTTAVPENLHVTVTSHGHDDINVNAFPLPPIPTYSSKTPHPFVYPISTTTRRPHKLSPVPRNRPKTFRIKV